MSASSGIPAETLIGEALRTAFPSWRTAGPTLLYCLRTLAAIGIALYTAFALPAILTEPWLTAHIAIWSAISGGGFEVMRVCMRVFQLGKTR